MDSASVLMDRGFYFSILFTILYLYCYKDIFMACFLHQHDSAPVHEARSIKT